jgi:hypothetical protein
MKCSRERSMWSRNRGIMGNGHVSREEILQYLELQHNGKEQTAQIHKLVSGRRIHFKYMAEEIKRNGTLKSMYAASYTGNG